MQKFLTVFVFIFMQLVLKAQNTSTVFESGKEGYASFRIPAIIQLPNKTLIAFAEGRLNGAADFGHIQLVMKKSKDWGKTWSALKVVANYDQWQVGNAAPVVDVLDPLYPKGRILLFYNTGNVNEQALRAGKGLREVWYAHSIDEGDNWSSPINITSQVHFPNGQMDDRIYKNEKDWRTYANTPGHATQCMEGQYKGRIYVAANHSVGAAQNHFKDYQSHGFYTDDHGKQFTVSSALNKEGSNEATAAFISGDRLIFNARNQQGNVKARIVAFSNDGGEHFEEAYYDSQLPDPVCEGAILNIGKKNKKTVLAFINAADTLNRNNLTLRISFNEGQSWPIKKLVATSNIEKPQQQDYTAYSDLVKISKRKIGVLYEFENYTKIVFTTLKW